MRNLFQASRILLLDLASTLLFLGVYAVTGNLFLAVGLGMALGIVQIGWQLANKQPVEALQWLSLVIIFASGSATFLTDDPLFIMMKPSIIYVIVGLVMLKRGWMTRYLPPIARATVPDLAITFGYVWAGMMFFSAVLNIVLALTLDVTSVGGREVGLGDRQQDRPVRHSICHHEVDRHPPGARHDGG